MNSKIKLIIKWILVALWMFVIFFLSSMSGIESNVKSKKTIDKALTETAVVTNNLNITNVNPESKKKVNIIEKFTRPLRKCMHASVYLVLCILQIKTPLKSKYIIKYFYVYQ